MNIKVSPKSIAKNDVDQFNLLHFITCGSVDDGKSTLIGRMLYDAGQIYDDQLDALNLASEQFGTQGKEIDFALMLDGLAAEREQGITIDVAYRYFRTKKRAFIVADTPGHEQYTRNMATGASNADVAIILIDARKGVLNQTRRHAMIVSLLGVKKIVLAVNKMDLVGYEKQTFLEIVENFNKHAHTLGFDEIIAIPLAAKDGDNIMANSKKMPWYNGQPLLEYLENVKINQNTKDEFYMPVQWVNRPTPDFRGFSGQIIGGQINVGDEIRVSSSGQKSKIARIVTFDGDLKSAQTNQSITITLEDEIDISRGDIIYNASNPKRTSKDFRANMLWMSENPMQANKEYLVKHNAKETNIRFTKTLYTIDFTTLLPQQILDVKMNTIAQIEATLDAPLLIEQYSKNRNLGSFIVIDKITNETVAMGMIDGAIEKFASEGRKTNSQNIKKIAKYIFPYGSNPVHSFYKGVKLHAIFFVISFILSLMAFHSLGKAIVFAFFQSVLLAVAHALYQRITSVYENSDGENIDGFGI